MHCYNAKKLDKNLIQLFTFKEYGNLVANYSSDSVLRSPRAQIGTPNSKTPGKTPSNAGGGRGSKVSTSRRNPLIGRTVKITKGPYKTYSGIVKATTETTASVELTAEYKTINVDLSRVIPIDQEIINSAIQSKSAYWNTPYQQLNTGSLAANTPRSNFMTPMYDGGKTPHAMGGQTPSYMTPHRYFSHCC